MKKITPEQVTQVVVMRSAGFTISSIAQSAGISVSSVKRICQKNGVQPGEALDHLIEQSKAELIQSISSDERVTRIAASLVRDTLIHAEEAREIAASASKYLKAKNIDEALLVMRACNAWANTLKLTNDAARSAIKIAPDNDNNEDLPELIVSVMTEEDVLAERQRQREEAKALGIADEDEDSDTMVDAA